MAASGDDAGLRLPPRLAPIQVRSSSPEIQTVHKISCTTFSLLSVHMLGYTLMPQAA